MANAEMFRRWLLVISIISCVTFVISDPTSTTTAPDKKGKSEGVNFKTSFPFGDGSQYYGGSPYGYPQDGVYGTNWPSYGQTGPVSYPSYVLPQQTYSPYPYNQYSSYQPYQSTPYSLYPQYGQYGTGNYQYGMPNGLPTNAYPMSTGGVSYLPENTGSTDILKILGSSNVVPSSNGMGDINSVLPFESNQQQFPNIYSPQLGFGSNGAPLGAYPSNSYDPFANVPVEIIDVDYTRGFKTAEPSVIPQYRKPIVKVTSHSDSNGASVQPIVRTHSSVVTMKPQHTVITRTYDSTKDGPTVNVQNHTDDDKEDVDDTTNPEETNDIPDREITKVGSDDDEEPSDVSSWFK